MGCCKRLSQPAVTSKSTKPVHLLIPVAVCVQRSDLFSDQVQTILYLALTWVIYDVLLAIVNSVLGIFAMRSPLGMTEIGSYWLESRSLVE
eukprot:5108423-Pleurochrysis_carterae.AAC.2